MSLYLFTFCSLQTKVIVEQRSLAAQSKKKAVETRKEEVCLSLMLRFKSMPSHTLSKLNNINKLNLN